MEDGVKDMEMWNACRNTNITIVDKLWMEDGVKDMEMWNACRNQHNYRVKDMEMWNACS